MYTMVNRYMYSTDRLNFDAIPAYRKPFPDVLRSTVYYGIVVDSTFIILIVLLELTSTI